MRRPNPHHEADPSHPPMASQPAPHLVWLSAVPWNFPLVGRTRMITEEWLELGLSTTFVQPAWDRRATQRTLARLIRRDAKHTLQPWPTLPAAVWPPSIDRWSSRTLRWKANALRHQLTRHVNFEHAVALIVSPAWVPWLDALPFRSVIYDCIDDLEVMTPHSSLGPLFQAWESELIERSDAVVTTAPELAATIRSRCPKTPIETIRNGVRSAEFIQRARNTSRPADLPRSGPIVGFVGALYDWIDWQLIERMAERMPECNFVFVGPRAAKPPTGPTKRLANLHLLGPRAYAEVPSYIENFDVCWVPFVDSRVSRRAHPVKVYEYLALGKPVLSTPISDPAHFAEWIQIATTDQEMEDGLRAALRQPKRDADTRRDFAALHSWRQRALTYRDFATAIAER